MPEASHTVMSKAAILFPIRLKFAVKDSVERTFRKYIVLHSCSLLWNITQNSNLLFRRDALGLVTSVIA
jgi:hypothetical protein